MIIMQKLYLKPRVSFLLPRQNICKKTPNRLIGHFVLNYMQNEDWYNCSRFDLIITAS